MKQVIVRKGNIVIEEVSVPKNSANNVLVRVAYSCISAGTEMTTVSSSGQNLIKKAIQYPEQVKQVMKNIKSSGLYATIEKVQDKLAEGSQMGYSSSGIVFEVGENIKDINPGDKVACAGAGIANHAEYISVPRNLLVKIPEGVTFDIASTVTVGAIAMQGIRRANVRLGEHVVVIGLGILGQLVVQILKASGARTVGIDLDVRRVDMALKFGLDYGLVAGNEDVENQVRSLTDGYGADAVIIATATKSNEPLSQAFRISRKKGRVILIGVVGMEIDRDEMYQKELDFFISTSYGPGRYDEEYESKGVQYPYAYVRWTENRNLQEYLRLIAEKRIDVKPLIEKIYPIMEAPLAYENLKNYNPKPLIVLLQYEKEIKNQIVHKISIASNLKRKQNSINIGIIGAGNFARNIHLPNLKRLNKYYTIYAIASKTGHKAKNIAKKYRAEYVTTDYKDILSDDKVDAVLIATRHNLHVDIAIEALHSGKAVFLEKPMALNEEDLVRLVAVIEKTKLPFMVGFNRRFSVFAQEAKKYTDKRVNPLIINYRMNAGYIPLDHWVHSEEGGGRIIGEGCHIFDLFNFFTGSEVEKVMVEKIKPLTGAVSSRDNTIIVIKYKDGSLCQLLYTSLGTSAYPKEYCEIFFDNKIITIDDYRKIRGYDVKIKNLKTELCDKGYYEELLQFARFVRGQISCPIPLWQMIQATKISFLSV